MAEKRPLRADDYRKLADESYVSREIADAAGIYRIASLDGRELIGRKGGGDFSGLVFPYSRAGEVVAHRLRLDHPPITNGKPEHKYLQAPGTRNRLYFPPAPLSLLSDPKAPLIITEGEKKALALWRMALETANGNGEPTFLPVALSGVDSWHGVTGKKVDAAGERVDEKGPIADLDLIIWTGRRVTILYDTNAASNWHVIRARRELAAELAKRGAEVWIADLPPENGINGCDDYLARHGVAALAQVLAKSRRYDWKSQLIQGDNGPRAILANALLALRHAPEWAGVLVYDEFRMRHLARRPTPWGFTGVWGDAEDLGLVDWLQHRGIMVGTKIAAEAAFKAAKDDARFHPVHDYLNGLTWDKKKRLDTWLTTYMGVKDEPYSRAVGTKWMLSAVARIFQPGVKADHMLVAEGPQGTFKSTAWRTLADPWFSDDMPTLGTKDAQMATLGAWIIELAELDAMNRSEWSHVKAFVTRQTDRFRPPYGRHMIEAPRQCIFVGTINYGTYLEDETGGRRFWPIRCGLIDIPELARDRDQLWAEAVARYRAGEGWWTGGDLDEEIRAQQEERYQIDAWEPAIDDYLDARTRVTTPEILEKCMQKPIGQWTRPDEMRVGKVLRHLGWEPAPGRERPRVYIRKKL